MKDLLTLNRRTFLWGGAAAAGMTGLFPAWAKSASQGLAAKGSGTLTGNEIGITIANSAFPVDGGRATRSP